MGKRLVRMPINNVPVAIVAAINYKARRLGISRDKLLNELFAFEFGELAKSLDEAANVADLPEAGSAESSHEN